MFDQIVRGTLLCWFAGVGGGFKSWCM